MSYVATFGLQSGPWLIRVDVNASCSLIGTHWIGRYTRTEADGKVVVTETTLGPDVHGMGVPTMAVANLVHDLRFGGFTGGFHVVHANEFTQEDLNEVLHAVGVIAATENQTTSRTLQ